MNITLGFSPCPNDCFIFDALVHQRIDTGGIKFDVILEDVETLNQMALSGRLDVTKLSFNAFGFATDKYILLRSGAALGFNCGPLLVSERHFKNASEIRTVAIPGRYTTANFLLGLAFPQIKEKKEYLFSEIEEAVLRGEVDAGLLIHENRFTYEARGLKKVMDLGEYWDSLIHAPIPLGGIAGRRTLGSELLNRISGLIHESLRTAFEDPSAAMPFVRHHAQTMSEEVMKKHIDLYVNKYSLDPGEAGRDAIRLFYDEGRKKGLFDGLTEPLMIS
jgi:1,4-dihydroxy-6-naphthoate synthase